MLSMYSASRPSAMIADHDCTQRMPFFMSMPAMCMGMAAATFSFILISETGVVTSVSLFVAALLALLILVVLVVLISLSLLLTGLTRLVVLESLVGLTVTRTASKIQAIRGD